MEEMLKEATANKETGVAGVAGVTGVTRVVTFNSLRFQNHDS